MFIFVMCTFYLLCIFFFVSIISRASIFRHIVEPSSCTLQDLSVSLRPRASDTGADAALSVHVHRTRTEYHGLRRRNPIASLLPLSCRHLLRVCWDTATSPSLHPKYRVWLTVISTINYCCLKYSRIICLSNIPTAGGSYSSPRSISGAEYCKDPHEVLNIRPGMNLLLNPKSDNLIKSLTNRQFSGLRSRWTTWSEWQYARAHVSWAKWRMADDSFRPPHRPPSDMEPTESPGPFPVNTPPSSEEIPKLEEFEDVEECRIM